MRKRSQFNNIAEPLTISIIVAIIGVIVITTAVFVGDFGFISIAILPTKAAQTASVLPTSAPTIAQAASAFNTPTVSTTPTPSIEDELVQMVASYYTCINSANPTRDEDYEHCWNLLSNRPGEFQSNLNKNDYTIFWKKYKVGYALYSCSKNLRNYVDAKYYLYDRNDLSHPIGTGDPFYLEWSFALDENGWRLKGADSSITEIGSYCESQPRIAHLTFTP